MTQATKQCNIAKLIPNNPNRPPNTANLCSVRTTTATTTRRRTTTATATATTSTSTSTTSWTITSSICSNFTKITSKNQKVLSPVHSAPQSVQTTMCCGRHSLGHLWVPTYHINCVIFHKQTTKKRHGKTLSLRFCNLLGSKCEPSLQVSVDPTV